jgi:hypothetical protein
MPFDVRRLGFGEWRSFRQKAFHEWFVITNVTTPANVAACIKVRFGENPDFALYCLKPLNKQALLLIFNHQFGFSRTKENRGLAFMMQNQGNSNKDCLVCGQCIKSCAPDNMQLLLRRPFHEADAREPLTSWPLTLFIMLVSGFVTSELTSEWESAHKIFVSVPEHIASALNLTAYSGWLEGFWTLFVFPLGLWSILGAVTVIFRRSDKISEAWRKLALPLAVIISAGHMSKALAKFTSWVGFLPLALRDPFGVNTATAIASKSFSSPTPWLSLHTVSILGLLLITIGIIFSIREARLANPNGYQHHTLPKLALAGLFLAIVVGWGG